MENQSPFHHVDNCLTPPIYPASRNSSSHSFASTSRNAFRSNRNSSPAVTFRSYRLREKYPQPWLEDKRMDKVKQSNRIVYCFMLFAACLSGYICFTGYKSVVNHPYCLVLEDDFKTLDTSIWKHEVQLDGFGTGTFDWTTTDDKNAYITSEGLRIRPTLTNESTSYTLDQIENGQEINLTADGTCTGSTLAACVTSSDRSFGRIINPVRSARLTTKGTKSIKFGKVEIIARLSAGKWMWPSLWMMPVNDTYGVWPKSGEIDIMEARGNEPGYPLGGIDSYSSSMHWGPSLDADAYWRSTSSRSIRRTDFSKGFHKFGVEWSDTYIFTYLDSRLYHVLWFGFDQFLWKEGKFDQATDGNHSYYNDPWSITGRKNTPFDQEFYLIMNVAVGGTNGFFPDGLGGKPWSDSSSHASADFWNAAQSWLPSWGKEEDRGMTIKSVKMWQQGKC